MSLQLFLGSAGSGKSYQLYREMIKQSKQEPDTNFLIIVPEQFTLQTQKDIVSMHPDHGVMNIDILSFLRFAYRIFEEVGGNDYPILEDTGKSMVLRRVVEEKKKELILFHSNVKKVGFINELKSLLSELYQYNIREDDFRMMLDAAGNKPLLKAKLQDIHTIYEGFGEFIRERYITAEEVLILLNNIIDQSEWIRNTVICFDGFTGFTPCQYQLLNKIMKYAAKVIVTVTIDPREKIGSGFSKHQLFSLSKKTIQKLSQIAEDLQIPVEEPVYAEKRNPAGVPYRFIDAPALAFLEHNLFRYPYEHHGKEPKDITLHCMRNSEAEVVFAAREIQRLVREEGYRYYDIAIVTGDVGQYGRVMKRIFSQENIPCFIDQKKDILNNPFVEFIRSAIAIVREDFSYESVFRYLKTGFSEMMPEDVDILENYVLATGIRGMKRYKEPFQRGYKTKEPIDLKLLNACREGLLQELLPLCEVLKDQNNTIKEYTTALYDLGMRQKAEEKLSVYRQYFQEHHMTLLEKEYDQVYPALMELYDQIVLLLGGEHCSLKEFGEIIETGLMEVKVGLIPPGVDEVVVGDTERTRLKDIKALFFVGVNEGIIPKTIGSGGILSDIERELLSNHHIELAPTKRQMAFTEQFYLYLNMTKPKNRLYMTYHRVNEDGKSVNPSFIIGKLKQLFPALQIVNEEDGGEDTKHILKDHGLDYLAKGLREYQTREQTYLWKELFLYYRSKEETNIILNHLIQGAFYQNREKGISKEAAKLLYGQELKGSITRLERYAGCAFAHFMSYGLSLEERKEYKLAVPDIGNIFHNAIDLFSKRLDESEYTWHSIPGEIREEWAVSCVEEAVNQYENSFIRSSRRNEYLVKRMERITIRTLWALCSQMKQGILEPMGYEMPFYHIPENFLTLQGRIDRMDLYETEDKVYVRIVDYKSGHTVFDFESIYYGLQQQLAVYLGAAMNYLKRRYDKKEIIPAGIFYYHIDDPIVDKSDRPEDEILRNLKMNGLANEDKEVLVLMDQNLSGAEGNLRASVKSEIIPIETNKDGYLTKRSMAATKNQMMALVDYVNHNLSESGKQILDGDTRLNPYRMGERKACDYCEYRTACGFDSRLPGHTYHNLAGKSAEEIKEKIWGNKDEMDKGTAEGN